MNIGIFGLLTIIFTVAKLAGVVAWPWLVVLSPVIISVLLRLAVVGTAVATVFLAAWLEGKK